MHNLRYGKAQTRRGGGFLAMDLERVMGHGRHLDKALETLGLVRKPKREIYSKQEAEALLIAHHQLRGHSILRKLQKSPLGRQKPR